MQVNTVPNVGEKFSLTINFDEVDPLEMARKDGYDTAGWNFTGRRPSGIITQEFKLVRVAPFRRIDDIRRALTAHGTLPKGMLREAFRQTYPLPDRQGPIGIADSSWLSLRGQRLFPSLGGRGNEWRSAFIWANVVRDVSWRWLVACSEETT